jgi:hypothetical protein
VSCVTASRGQAVMVESVKSGYGMEVAVCLGGRGSLW